jgi:hypothetical protein
MVMTVSPVQLDTSLHRTKYKDNETGESCGLNGKIWYSTTGTPLPTEGMRPGMTETIMESPRLSWDYRHIPS